MKIIENFNKEIKSFNDYENFLKELRKRIGDNDVRISDIYPCCCDFKATKENIDKPFFSNNDWKKFWEVTKKYYPLHSVAGNFHFDTKEKIVSGESSNIKDFIGDIDSLKNKNVLEIGFGFGGAGFELLLNNINYFGIDYTYSNDLCIDFKQNNEKRFFEISESGIPNNLKTIKYDLIFSKNVFQHLTQEQRFDYIKESYSLLNNGGKLIFDVFEKSDKYVERDSYSTLFFGVQTKIENEDELETYLIDCGYIFKKEISCKCCEETNVTKYECIKII